MSVQQREGDITDFEKLAEGGFDRSFLVTIRNSFRLVARVPYPATKPKLLVIASEVATIDFLRPHGIPVPKIFRYSAAMDNPAGTEYIFMEYVQGTNLGDIWFALTAKERAKILTSLVQLESRLFNLSLPAAGSVYYSDDLLGRTYRINFLSRDSTNDSRFCIGPDTSLGLWYGKRHELPVDRGPCKC
jgi:hypothetical protein